ncbi:hypothetical protein OIE68_45785 [Nocardia vinacea]|nr:hypothetical protein OIE68_45785 [Nocardia vinacea]
MTTSHNTPAVTGHCLPVEQYVAGADSAAVRGRTHYFSRAACR